MSGTVRPDLRQKRNFILGQGLDDPPPESCAVNYSALQFQPRCVTLWTLLGTALQSPAIFFTLSGVLWWSALLPAMNPFEWIYNATIGSRPGRLRLRPSPRPRRFAMGVAGAFSLAIGISLQLRAFVAAYLLEAVLLLALAALVFGGFCLGSFVYHLMRGNRTFAVDTLPWKPRK